MEYDFPRFFNTLYQFHPYAIIFSDAGPDVRWVGDEDGEAGLTSWPTVNFKVL